MKELVIKKYDEGGRLDKFLFRYLDGASKSFVYKMMRKKNITYNGGKAAGNEILNCGDIIKIYFSDETLNKFHNADAGAIKTSYNLDISNIIYEDENIIAVNKPSGLLSQKSHSNDISLNDMLIAYLLNKNTYYDGEINFIPGISNRLDRNTSGLILAGKNPAASRELNRCIKKRCITKIYSAIVKGNVDREMMLDAFLKKDENENKVEISDIKKDEGFLPVKTRYIPVISNGDISLINIDLITGRSHQIRAHLSSQDHPLIGDTKYGDKEINIIYKNKYLIKHQMLHAGKIIFDEPADILSYLKGKEIVADMPDDFIEVLKGEHLWQPGTAEDSEANNLKKSSTDQMKNTGN